LGTFLPLSLPNNKKYSSWRVPQIPPPFILGDQFEGETGFREKTRDQTQGEFTDNSLMHPLFRNNSRSKLP